VFLLFVYFMDVILIQQKTMSDDKNEECFDLTGLVQVVFSEDRLKLLLQRVHTILDRHGGCIAAI